MYTAHEFTIPTLTGISETNIKEHLGLYAGYVKNTNKVLEIVQDESIDAYARAEAQRRLSFEFNGMRNHEHYFHALEGGPQALAEDSALYQKITEQWGSFDGWLDGFKSLAKTRGVGWAILYYDREYDKLLNVWVDEQHLGHLNSCDFIFGIDMWEHAFVADYQPSGKGQYIEDYLANVNWSYAAGLFEK